MNMAIKRGYIYVAGNVEQNLYKIGFCRMDPRRRVTEVQLGCPLELELVYWVRVKQARIVEKMLHEHFVKYQILSHGKFREWFKFTLMEIQEIDRIIPETERFPLQSLDCERELDLHCSNPPDYVSAGSWCLGKGLLIE